MSQCVWDKAWIGRCKNTAITNFNPESKAPDLCADHSGKTCVSCGAVATRDCEHTGIQFVCGAPICANCTHGLVMPGENPGIFNLGGGHVTREKAREQWEQWAEFDRLEEAMLKKERE